MKVYKTVAGLQRYLSEIKGGGKQIGFVPTMGLFMMDTYLL